jgi:DNA-binding XRE family transcriptional regulator
MTTLGSASLTRPSLQLMQGNYELPSAANRSDDQTVAGEKGLTQAELAKKAKVTRPYITMLESGVRKTPSLPMLQRLAKAFSVSVTALLE